MKVQRWMIILAGSLSGLLAGYLLFVYVLSSYLQFLGMQLILTSPWSNIESVEMMPVVTYLTTIYIAMTIGYIQMDLIRVMKRRSRKRK